MDEYNKVSGLDNTKKI
jgi:hypothetical protein